jgi:hypothetical protein
MQFLSVEWFEALKARAEADDKTFRRLGFCDAVVRVDVEDEPSRSIRLTFADYGCERVEEVSLGADADFALVAGVDVWREMFENIQANGGADLQHTLNYLQLPGIIRLEAVDQGQADMFYRFSQTFQAFFDQAAAVPTEFGEAVPAGMA